MGFHMLCSALLLLKPIARITVMDTCINSKKKELKLFKNVLELLM